MTCRDSLDLVDVAVVGAGPAGLSAALYAARAGLTTGVFGDPYEGQLARAGTVENFPTYKQPVEGLQLVESMVDQAGHWGATIRDQEIRQIVRHDDRFQLLNQEADAFCAYAVVLAMGTKFKKLGVTGEDQHYGHGVSYCTVCDGPLYRGKPVAVLGFGPEAAAAALRMSTIASSVHLVSSKPRLGVEELLLARLSEAGNVEVFEGGRIEEIVGDQSGVTAIRLLRGGEVVESEVQAVFIEVGTLPASAIAQDLGVELEAGQFIKIHGLQQTSVPGVFAAGDVTGTAARQAVIAAGEGARAAIGVIDYIKSLGLSAEKSRLHSVQWGKSKALQVAPQPVAAAPTGIGSLALYVRHDPAFLRNYESYEPDLPTVERIGQALPEAHVVVVSATWCPDCRRNVPRLAKIADHLPGWQFEVYAREDEETASRYGIRAIPTFIVLDPASGRELGRIIENPAHGSVEADLASIAERR